MVEFYRVLLGKNRVLGWCGRSTSSTGIKLQQVETVEKGWAATVVVLKVAALATAILFSLNVSRGEVWLL